jgi:antagonist of KipI
MNLRIIKAGVLDTIQDMGRFGYQHQGINPGGTMDRLSSQLANIVVGNPPHQALIEMHFPASEFFFEQPALIALGGGDFSAHVNGEEIPCLHPILLSKYSILQFHRLSKGARAYLAIRDGLKIDKRWLGSDSTNIKAMAGGFKGRPLQKDDEIPLHELALNSVLLKEKEFQVLPWQADDRWGDDAENEILVLPGNEWERLSPDSQKKFFSQSFDISAQSDRMGFRLKSYSLTATKQEEILSSAVSWGTVQLLPDGQLILLMADHQTTGGYPRIAHVISAHHSKLAQLRPGENIRFRLTDQQKAEELLIKQQQHLLQLQNACTFRLDEYLRRV